MTRENASQALGKQSTSFALRDQGCVVCKQRLENKEVASLRFGTEPSKVKQIAVCSRAEVDIVSVVRIMEGVAENLTF